MTKIPSSSDNRLFWIAAAVIVVFIYFFGLTIPLLGPDEPRYSQVAREMFERGDWVTPTLGGFHWFEKPALLYWLQIVSYNLFGVSEFSARFGSALFGLGTVGALWLIGRGLERAQTDESRTNDFANWLALISASSIGLIVFARGASFDIILTFPITAAMVCFFLYDLSQMPNPVGWEKKGTFALFGFYFFVGVALLAKGLVGALFPGVIVGFYFILSRRRPSRSLMLSLVWGPVVAFVVAANWYLPMYLRHGWEFVDEFFVQHHFQRYTSNKYLHPQPFHFFFWVLPLMTIPWLPFFLVAVWKFGKRAVFPGVTETSPSAAGSKGSEPAEASQKDPRGGPVRGTFAATSFSSAALLRFAAAWLLVPLVFFSFSGSKLPGYILPALPPAMIITAMYVMEFIRRGGRRPAVLKALAMATFVVCLVIIVFVLPRFADMDSVKGLIETANSRGYTSEKVLTLYTVSHNAEFYAPDRLARDPEGRQLRLSNPTELISQIEKSGSAGALVIVPLELMRHLVDSSQVVSEVIRDNGEFAIVYVRPR